jgi:hypothetical protein
MWAVTQLAILLLGALVFLLGVLFPLAAPMSSFGNADDTPCRENKGTPQETPASYKEEPSPCFGSYFVVNHSWSACVLIELRSRRRF